MIKRFKTYFSNLKLKTKIILITLINFLMILIPLSISLVLGYYKENIENYEFKYLKLAEAISEKISGIIVFEQYDKIQKELDQVLSDINVLNTYVYDQNGIILFSQNKKSNLDLISIQSKINLQDKNIGLLTFDLRKDPILNKTYNYIYYISLLNLISFVIASIIISWLQKYITRPIIELNKFTLETKIDENIEFYQQNYTKDEIGELHSSFAKFISTINKYRKDKEFVENQLKELNQSLEKLIEERTAQLRETNKLLTEESKSKIDAQQELIDLKIKEINNTKYKLLERNKAEEKFKNEIIGNFEDKVQQTSIIETFNKYFNNDITSISKYIEDIDEKYISLLLKKFDKLTNSEARLCSLIKSGLSTKDCAAILHVTPKTIENHRNSIRKKLKLERGTNLNLFLINLTS